ncbi:ABC transporter permease [Calidifontibacillus erzurumensis]|uniref:ABC-2 family transporter protein n=1 Tax=Calidifontibacillus erzurumensis TaxID=2741433 RepID=A0A8J8GF05_9BACI|nr:ABC-2 family transporter protein [Calidifontibacillus erzurumensis]NSL52122.1 ABC-2 family transporter protein [Calidifontibacillus erzurumensis]
MSKYIEMIRIRFLMMLAYRTNYYSGILNYSINIGAYYFLWKAIYGDKQEIEGLAVSQMVTYIAIGWMARAFYFNNIDREIALEVKDGKVAVELIRPYNYLTMKMMAGLGEGLFRLLFFSLPGMVLISFIFPLEFSSSLTTWFYFGISTILSFVVNSELNLLAGIMTFFFYNIEGLLRAKRVLIDLFSGLILPISFFPQAVQQIMMFFPFQAISYIPSMIFTEGLQGHAMFQALLFQLIWAVLLVIPIQVLWIFARRKLVVQGG